MVWSVGFFKSTDILEILPSALFDIPTMNLKTS